MGAFSRWLGLGLLLLLGCAGGEAARVRAEVGHAWNGYVAHAWGHDELRPVSRTPRDWYGASLLITPVDSLDTLILVGMSGEAARDVDLIARTLRFDQDVSVKVFEITIRVLGGLLSGYQLTHDPRLLALADDLGRRLLPAFETPTGMPYMFVNLRTGAVRGSESNPAEIGTLLLEFGTLARLTHKDVYYNKAKQATIALYARRSALGLVGEGIDVETGAWTRRASHVGGGIDSYYEYLLKSWLLFGDEDCRRMWRASADAVVAHVADEQPAGLWFGEVDMETGRRTATTFGALEAFLPAVLALGGDVARARRLEDSAYLMWRAFGVEPDGYDYVTGRATEPGYPLRPEIIESAYYLHHYTGDSRYRDMGRRFLDDLVACCRTDAGYTTLDSVITRARGDLMPSYFLAETLKYLYLLAEPGAIDLDKVVFNTEAHPLRRTW
jgi:mannosidase alpha-like ER degradation enhancer 2